MILWNYSIVQIYIIHMPFQLCFLKPHLLLLLQVQFFVMACFPCCLLVWPVQQIVKFIHVYIFWRKVLEFSLQFIKGFLALNNGLVLIVNLLILLFLPLVLFFSFL